MTTRIEGIYKKGLIKPLKSVNLPDNFLVEIYINFPDQQRLSKEKILAESAGILPNLSKDYVRKIRKASEVRLKQKWHE